LVSSSGLFLVYFVQRAITDDYLGRILLLQCGNGGCSHHAVPNNNAAQSIMAAAAANPK
jgi:hypothetical protein